MITAKHKKGFGLIEVLLASVITAMMLGALISVGRVALASNQNALERTQAAYLAQQGIEVVRQIRDTNWIDGGTTSWDSLTGNTKLHTVDVANYKLRWDSGRYLLEPDLTSAGEIIDIGGNSFRREIQVQNESQMGTLVPTDGSLTHYARGDSVLRVVVVVKFRDGTKEVSVSEILTNWRPNY
ncbi:MAG: prepilin-type N-terminal cleavage/methylation domain-containing protein [Patescibacteria group bacterium]|jgi:type II secretory pathway pseudopilin PulG